jgi:dihydroorotate dehydrogenase (fumarate)
MADLKTSYMGISLDNPLVVSSSGITGRMEGIERCADAGAGAVVLKSMFEEIIIAETNGLEEELLSAEHPEAADYVRAEIGKRLGPLPYLEFIEEVRKKVSVPVIASVNCITPHWWVPYARRIEAAGADGLELNISHFPRGEGEDSLEIEKRYTEIVQKVTDQVSIPVAVKLGFYFTSLWNVIEDVVAAGAKAVVLFNRYHSVDVDLDARTLVPAVKFSSPGEVLLPMRWIGLAADRLRCDIAASTGVQDSRSVLKLLMVGATVVQVCSALYRNGPEYIGELKQGVSSWLDEEGFESVDSIRGLALKNAEGEEALLTRLQYVKSLEEASNLYKF